MDESHRKSDSAASASKSLGSLVQINSIAIDISSAMEEIESPAHEHFSIRGFVAGMRKKDWKACLPFASEVNGVDLVDNLPPLFVPRFRWWQCSNCIPDIATKRSIEEIVLAGRSDAGANSCQDVGENILHIRENLDGKDNDPSTTFMKSSLCCIEGHKAITCSNDKINVRNKEAGNPCADMPEANPFQIRERINNTEDASDMVHDAVLPLRIVDEAENASSGSDGAFSALPHRRKPKLRSLADIMVVEKIPTSDNPRTRSASSSGMQVTSTEMEAVLSPQLELDVPAEAAKATRSPQRKRKFAPEEDKGRLGFMYPSPVAKRFRGLMLDAEKNCRRVEITDSESEGDASVRLDLQLGAKTQQIKPKKTKALDIRKKMRQTRTEDGIVPVRQLPKINAVCCADLPKHAVSPGPSSGKLGYASSTMGEMESYSRSSLSGKQADRLSNTSKSKTPEVEADHDPLMPPSKNILQNSNVKEKVALDLSLNSFMDAERNSNNQASYRQHRGIPDLNEAFPQKAAMTQGKQLPTFSEKRSFPLHKNLDVSASCSKETTRECREGKRQVGVPELQNKDNDMEVGASDDIPMEIVELMAKNQRDRALGNSMRHLLPDGINNSTRGYPTLYMDGRSGMINFPLANRRNGVTVADGNMGARQSIPVNCPQLNNCQLDMSKPEEGPFRLFSSSTSSQQRKTLYSASSSILTGPRSSTAAELLWSPTRDNVPFHLSIPRKHSIQPHSMGVYAFSDQRHQGKTISGIKDGKDKNAIHDAAVLEEGRIGSSSTSLGSLDPYSNDTIPAMQLLSLMDQRIVSGSPFEAGPKNFLDKPFSPCNHHPRLNGKENQNFLGGPFFSQNSHSKDFSGLRYGYCSGESSKKASSYLPGQIHSVLGNSKATPLEGSSNLVIWPPRTDPALGVCTLNRNPADFSIPDARNEFTLSAKDLKPRKRNASKEKSRYLIVEGRKRQKVRKDTSGKESSRK